TSPTFALTGCGENLNSLIWTWTVAVAPAAAVAHAPPPPPPAALAPGVGAWADVAGVPPVVDAEHAARARTVMRTRGNVMKRRMGRWFLQMRQSGRGPWAGQRYAPAVESGSRPDAIVRA